jgi:hypothetical protein
MTDLLSLEARVAALESRRPCRCGSCTAEATLVASVARDRLLGELVNRPREDRVTWLGSATNIDAMALLERLELGEAARTIIACDDANRHRLERLCAYRQDLMLEVDAQEVPVPARVRVYLRDGLVLHRGKIAIPTDEAQAMMERGDVHPSDVAYGNSLDTIGRMIVQAPDLTTGLSLTIDQLQRLRSWDSQLDILIESGDARIEPLDELGAAKFHRQLLSKMSRAERRALIATQGTAR